MARMKGDVKATFKQVDADQSGFIDKDELRNVLQKLGGNVTEDEVDACYAELDENEDGKIDYNEFSGWYMRSETKIKKDVTALFKRFDHNGDGNIEADELKALVQACNGMYLLQLHSIANSGFTDNFIVMSCCWIYKLIFRGVHNSLSVLVLT